MRYFDHRPDAHHFDFTRKLVWFNCASREGTRYLYTCLSFCRSGQRGNGGVVTNKQVLLRYSSSKLRKTLKDARVKVCSLAVIFRLE